MKATSFPGFNMRQPTRMSVRLVLLLLAALTVPALSFGQDSQRDRSELIKELEVLGREAAGGSPDAIRNFTKAIEDSGLAPARSTDPYIIADTGAGVYFSGRMTRKAIEALQQRIVTSQKNSSTLIIDSPGGYDEPAIDLGRFLLDRRIRVVVRNRCISACANFVFLPAFEKAVEPNSIVAFHQSVLWWDRMAREGRLNEDRQAFEARASIAQKGAELLKDGSKERDLNEVLVCMMEFLEPKLDSIKPTQMTDDEGKMVSTFTVDARFALAIISPTDARFLGIPGIVEFWWGKPFEETRFAIERSLGRGMYIFGGLGARRLPCPKGSTGVLPTPWAFK